ncbi:MAG: RICIN domain-containing protein [Marinifilaceae bacterium]|nr:RICIN domain-containing protein [Marinifilaceae bacterium]
MPTDRGFYIQSAMSYGSNGGYWDIPGGKNPSLKAGKNVEIWEKNGGQDQIFCLIKTQIDGFYEICVSYGRNYRVNVDGGKSSKGTNVELWTNNSNNRQNFRFKHLGAGRFKIYTMTNRILTLKNRQNSNGTNIHIWEDSYGKWTEWYLIDAKTKARFIPGSSSTMKGEPRNSVGKTMYQLQSGEEFVFGKTGVSKSGNIKYNLAIVRKPNSSKRIYNDSYKEYDFTGVIQGSPNLVLKSNPQPYYKYDFFLIFNGQKFGPYDAIYDLHQADPRIDNWVSDDGKTISFAGQKGNHYMAVIHNKELRKFYLPSSAPEIDYHTKSEYFAASVRGVSFLAKNQSQVNTGWKDLNSLRISPSGKIFYVGKKSDGKYYMYLDHKQIHGPIKYDSRSKLMKVYYDINKALGLEDKNNYYFSGNKLIYRVNNLDGTTSVVYGSPNSFGYAKKNFPKTTNVSPIYEYQNSLFVIATENKKSSIYQISPSSIRKVHSSNYYCRICDTKTNCVEICNPNGKEYFKLSNNGVGINCSNPQIKKREEELKNFQNQKSSSYKNVSHFVTNSYKNRFAFNYNDQAKNWRFHEIHPSNLDKASGQKLVVDGEVKYGKYGQAEYIDKLNSFVAIKQIGNKLQIVKL